MTYHVGDPVPYVVTREQLAGFMGYSLKQIDTFRRRRNHPAIKQLVGPGAPRFCGRTLKAWLDNQGAEGSTSRRFFAHAGGR